MIPDDGGRWDSWLREAKDGDIGSISHLENQDSVPW